MNQNQTESKPQDVEEPHEEGLDEVLAGNALFFLLDLRPLYEFVNNSDAPRSVKDCLQRINLAAASIEGALGSEGYTRAKARDEKMKSDLDQFLSQNPEAAETAKTTSIPAVDLPRLVRQSYFGTVRLTIGCMDQICQVTYYNDKREKQDIRGTSQEVAAHINSLPNAKEHLTEETKK
jgi:hypothetical protein